MTQDFNPIDELLRDQIERMTPEQREVFVAMEVSRLADHVGKQNGRIGKNEVATARQERRFDEWTAMHQELHAKWIGAKEVIVFLCGGGIMALIMKMFG
jgi:hypothetical protein